MKNYLRKKQVEYMLNNAGRIQYLMNVLEDSYDYLFLTWEEAVENHFVSPRKHKINDYVLITWHDSESSSVMRYDYLGKSEYKFLIKGRAMHSGLATPMARYYAWKALERKGF